MLLFAAGLVVGGVLTAFLLMAIAGLAANNRMKKYDRYWKERER